jgi:hypothetical protein
MGGTARLLHAKQNPTVALQISIPNVRTMTADLPNGLAVKQSIDASHPSLLPVMGLAIGDDMILLGGKGDDLPAPCVE